MYFLNKNTLKKRRYDDWEYTEYLKYKTWRIGESMDKFKILSGNACFLVQNTSGTMSREDFEDYLKKEGFEEFRKYGWCDRGSFYINVNSLRYSAGVYKAAPLTGTIVGESIKNPFTIDEFKTIWNILKKHMGNLNSTNEIRKGYSTFLVADEILEEYHNEFIDYLKEENFKELSNDSYGGRGFVAVNVKSMLYSKGFVANALVSSFVGENSSCSLTIEEFKIVWNILKKHKQDKSAEKIVKKQPNIVDVKESEISKRLTECCKFKDYNNIDEYIGDVKFCLIHSCRYPEETAISFIKDEIDLIKREYASEYPAYDLAMDYYPICG